MAKLLGIRERTGTAGYALSWLDGYERPGTAEAEGSPYDYTPPARALGQPGETPFDLSDPDAVLELKQALYQLALLDADPLRNPVDRIREEAYKRMAMTGRYASSWDGPSADEFVMAVSRYAPDSGLTGPFMTLGGSRFGKYGIVGGPQPTAAGLELIAGAVEERLGGYPRMSRYLAWRGGVFDPPSETSGPGADAVVLPIQRHGAAWQRDGYTVVDHDEGVPVWVAQVAEYDEALVECWHKASTLATDESSRWTYYRACMLPLREQRHEAAKRANANMPEPDCPAGYDYDRARAECVKLPDVPSPETDQSRCIADAMKAGMSRRQAENKCLLPGQKGPIERAKSAAPALAVGAAIGLGVWWWTSKKR